MFFARSIRIAKGTLSKLTVKPGKFVSNWFLMYSFTFLVPSMSSPRKPSVSSLTPNSFKPFSQAAFASSYVIFNQVRIFRTEIFTIHNLQILLE